MNLWTRFLHIIIWVCLITLSACEDEGEVLKKVINLESLRNYLLILKISLKKFKRNSFLISIYKDITEI